MDPVTAIVGALAAGALHGVTDTAADAVKDAYTGLRDAVAARFAGHPDAELVLAGRESDPTTHDEQLAAHLRESGAAQDPRIRELAERLNSLLEGRGSHNTTVDARGSQGAVIGHGNTVSQVFGAPPREP